MIYRVDELSYSLSAIRIADIKVGNITKHETRTSTETKTYTTTTVTETTTTTTSSTFRDIGTSAPDQ